MVTGHLNNERDLDHVDWARLALGAGTLIVYMGIANLAEITRRLTIHGRSPQTPVALVRWASTARQVTLTGTLADIAGQAAAADFQPPAVIIIGEVVGLRARLRWFDNRPLFGRRILVTRAADQAAALCAPLAELGAEPVLCPTITIVPPVSCAELDAAITQLADIDYLILTSTNAVAAFFSRLAAAGRDARALAGITLVAVGPTTAAALGACGVHADRVPAEHQAEGVVALLRAEVAGKRVLYPRAALARDLLTRELTAAGATVIAPVAYASNVPAGAAACARAALAEGLDLLTFTAGSTVRNFVGLLSEEELAQARTVPVAVIGQQTATAARECGFLVAVEPAKATIDSMVAAIADYYRPQPA
jgi:uroporphyrinogen III methyltransferase/synthase